MLRALVLLLVLANGVFFMWTQGHLSAWGLKPSEQGEPERLQQQIAPGSIRLLNIPRESSAPNMTDSAALQEAPGTAPTPTPATEAAAATAAPTPAPVAQPVPAVAAPSLVPEPTASTRSCWQASGFTPAQADTLRASLAMLGLPAESWQLREIRSPARWLVYMGRYDNTAQLERKRGELRELNFEARSVTTPGLAPGLSLGAYPTEAAARVALQNVSAKGIRTARVALEYAEAVSHTLRLPTASPAQRSAVAALGPALAGKTLQACN